MRKIPASSSALTAMFETLERNRRTFRFGYWIAVGVGFLMAALYIASSWLIDGGGRL